MPRMLSAIMVADRKECRKKFSCRTAFIVVKIVVVIVVVVVVVVIDGDVVILLACEGSGMSNSSRPRGPRDSDGGSLGERRFDAGAAPAPP